MRTGSTTDRLFPAALIGLAVLAVVIPVLTADGGGIGIEGRPNVLIVSIDPLRADHLPCYGYDRRTAPNICDLANDSLVFTRAYTSATWTLPAYASMMTGRYPSDHGVYYRNRSVPAATVFPEVMGRNGYRTAAFVGSTDGVGDLRPKFGLDRGFENYTGGGLYLDSAVPPAQRWLRRNGDDRFLLWVQGYEPHSPYKVPNHTDRFDPGYDGVVDGLHINDVSRIKVVDGSPRLKVENGTVRLTEADIEHFIAEYDGQVRTADRRVGDLLDTLRASGLYDETIVIVTSAHGETLADRRLPNDALFGHGSVYRENVRIPLIVHLPGLDHREIERPVLLMDLMPTLIRMAGGEVRQAGIDARDLLSPTRPRDRIYHEAPRKRVTAVRTDRWTYIDRSRVAGLRSELYEPGSDPGERQNVIGRYPAVASRLERLVQDHRLAQRRDALAIR